jgi:hypothetical protein
MAYSASSDVNPLELLILVLFGWLRKGVHHSCLVSLQALCRSLGSWVASWRSTRSYPASTPTPFLGRWTRFRERGTVPHFRLLWAEVCFKCRAGQAWGLIQETKHLKPVSVWPGWSSCSEPNTPLCYLIHTGCTYVFIFSRLGHAYYICSLGKLRVLCFFCYTIIYPLQWLRVLMIIESLFSQFYTIDGIPAYLHKTASYCSWITARLPMVTC